MKKFILAMLACLMFVGTVNIPSVGNATVFRGAQQRQKARAQRQRQRQKARQRQQDGKAQVQVRVNQNGRQTIVEVN